MELWTRANRKSGKPTDPFIGDSLDGVSYPQTGPNPTRNDTTPEFRQRASRFLPDSFFEK